MKREIATGQHNAGPFSEGVGAGNWVFVSGQGGIDPITGNIAGHDLASQTVQTMKNIGDVLAAANLQLDDIVKVNVYLSNREWYEEFNRIYRTFFEPPYPSRTTVYCELNYGLLVEIDAIAAVPASRSG